ncbi:MAG: hypothetical protein ACOCX1_06200 [Fimbriimonadaceae bacterium]
MRALAVVSFLLWAAIAFSQTAPPLKKGEGLTALTQIENAFRRIHDMPARPAPRFDDGEEDEVLEREAIVREFDRIYRNFKDRFVQTPRPLTVYEEIVRQRNDSELAATILNLGRQGFVSPVGPIAVGPEDEISIRQYAKALSFFFTRLAHYLNVPDPEFTPNIKDR